MPIKLFRMELNLKTVGERERERGERGSETGSERQINRWSGRLYGLREIKGRDRNRDIRDGN